MIAEIIALTLALGIVLGLIIYHTGVTWRMRKDAADREQAKKMKKWEPKEFIQVGRVSK